uniref:Reverse transcriptase/retrotransposon-derived protein RNase H-like domain-containing protein n=1 Tax=Esox lucius TaxID=8010 RepID=A0A3P8XMS4_ESOLU
KTHWKARSGQLAQMMSKLIWSTEAQSTFTELKHALQQAPALGLPDYTKPFDLYAAEKAGFANAVLIQKHNRANRPVAWYSHWLDPVERRMPTCDQGLAAIAFALKTSSKFLLSLAPSKCRESGEDQSDTAKQTVQMLFTHRKKLGGVPTPGTHVSTLFS